MWPPTERPYSGALSPLCSYRFHRITYQHFVDVFELPTFKG
jgi:hypothetical protein